MQLTFTGSASFLNDPAMFWLMILMVVILFIVGALVLLRSFLHHKYREVKAFRRVVLQILVPKERKTEGDKSTRQEDRLDQIREETAITETFFSTIAGLHPQRGLWHWLKGRTDYFSFELVSYHNLISFYIDVPKHQQGLIEQQLHAQYPYAQIEEMTDYNIFYEHSAIVGAYIIDTRPHVFPFKTYKTMDSDPMAAILNVLGKMHEGNSAAAVQYIVRPAHKRWRRRGGHIVRGVKKGESIEMVAHRGPVKRFFHQFWKMIEETAKKDDKNKPKEQYEPSEKEKEMLKGIEEKISKGGFDVTIRLLSSSDNESLARQNLDNLIHAFAQYNIYRYGNSFGAIVPRGQTRVIREFIYRSFHEKRKLTLNTEEIASLWHLPLHSTEAPFIKWLSARKAPPPSNLPTEGVLLGHVKYRGEDFPVHMKEADRRRHLYVVGKSGVGKSVFLQNVAIQDIEAGRGVGVVDPHGDLVEHILEHIPKERADDVVLFNPSDVERPIGLNMLEAKTADQKDFAVQEMIAIFYKLFPPEMIGPMFEHNMRNVMLTLMADINDPGTIIDIPRMFTDDDYVKIYLKKLKDPVVRAFWEKEMAKTSDFHKSEMLGYLISKVGRFVENEMMRNIMGQQQSGFDFRDIMDNQKILLVNLSKGTTGEVNAKLLGLIIVAKLQMAALGRADIPEEQRKDFYLYIDEFQNFITDSISTILSEARKYKLDLIVAHQYMAQLMDDKGKSPVRDAVLGNAGTIVSFRIGPDDAEVLEKEFAPTFGAYDLINVEQYTAYTKLLIDNTASRPFNMMMYPPKKGNAELAAAIKELSRLKYGRDRRIIEAEILERTKLGAAASESKNDMIESSL
ncbi:MAG: type IV secretion system DNA-binding domain-containing protein [Patescibacteria group bacterium]